MEPVNLDSADVCGSNSVRFHDHQLSNSPIQMLPSYQMTSDDPGSGNSLVYSGQDYFSINPANSIQCGKPLAIVFVLVSLYLLSFKSQTFKIFLKTYVRFASLFVGYFYKFIENDNDNHTFA